MSDTQTEYKKHLPRELKENEISYGTILGRVLNDDGTQKRPIDFELELRNDVAMDHSPSRNYPKGFKQDYKLEDSCLDSEVKFVQERNRNLNTDTRKKTYEIEYAKDGVLIKGFIDGVLTDTGICKFNKKDKLDVN